VLFVVEWEELFNENQATKFKVHTKMSSRIGVLRIFPGITPEAVSVLTVCLLYEIFNGSISGKFLGAQIWLVKK